MTDRFKNKIIIRKPDIFLFSLVIAFLLIIFPVNALTSLNNSVTISNITESSLTWQISYFNSDRPDGAIYDGVLVDNFFINQNTTYTVSKLDAGTMHTFCIYDNTSVNCETGKTTENKYYDFFNKYFMLIICLALMIAALFIPFFGLISVIFSIFALIQSFQSGDFWFFFIFVCVFFASITVFAYSMSKKR